MKNNIEKRKIPELRFPEFNDELRSGIMKKFGKFYYGKSAPKQSLSKNATTPCVRYGELYSTYGEVIKEIKSYTIIEPEKLKLSKGGEVLIPRVGEKALDFANASYLPYPNIAIGEMISVYETNENGLYLTYYINSRLKYKFAKVVEGGSVSNLYFRYLENINLVLPSISEQEKIANFLSFVDEKIEKMEKQKELLEEWKKGAMQSIFSKEKELRFKPTSPEEVTKYGGAYPEWEEKRLGEYIIPKSLKNKDLSIDLVLSVSNKKGFITQNEQFDGHVVASKDLSNYKIVKKNQIAYNPSRINIGSIARLKDFEVGIVSPMYVIFELKKSLDIIFFENLLETHRFKHDIKVGCSGSVRDSLNFNDLAGFKVFLPCFEEQEKIANFLSSVDEKIEKVTKEIEELKEWKKGLMQKMFV